ncbi:hypothetical protein SFRURICE_017272 [Spodoptera frugiperda]|uniref:SFRICE_002716 n=1 Tax=Spodoptera frugiperda TaxID=7108 RepID=A0A2H1VYG2_SPOFR|nr:hypothetical protein SFRURICE_017272 [Spodoptera frugiperda]
MNDCLGSRNETNQKMLLEEKKKKTIVSTSLGTILFDQRDRDHGNLHGPGIRWEASMIPDAGSSDFRIFQ